ncbi:beta strand repeat-containing protein, partial [Marinomonas alcarazii]|uniref:beta strand repeat-containing protein n=1 Tax=Marinomonas alcarazii TaxID=491949 RepID=UPI0011B40FDE
ETLTSAWVNVQNLFNTGTVLAQDESLSVEAVAVENQGALTGNGISINANTLTNSGASSQIFSSDSVDLTIDGDVTNTDGALVHAGSDLTLDAKGNVINRATIEAVKSTAIKSQNLTNSGTILAQDRILSIETSKLENQGTLSGNGLVINATELDNTTSTAQIVSSDKVDLTIDGDVTNTDGALVHADTDLILDAKGNVTNSATIEAVESTTVKSQNLSNSGTILAQDSGLSIETNKIDNQGTLSGSGLAIIATTLDNRTENGKILSSDKLDLTIDGDVTNTDGALIHADKALAINAQADLNNSNSIIETLTNAWVNVQNLFNTGTVLAQNESLSIEAVTVENQDILSGNGLVIKAGELDNTTNTAQIVSSDKVDLTIQGEITNTDGALLHSDTDLTLDAKGNLTNSGTIEAVKSTTITSQNLTNSGTVLAQDHGLSIETNTVDNQGTLSGAGIAINAEALDNRTDNGKILSSEALDLTIEGDITNTDGALIHADKALVIDAKGDLSNSESIIETLTAAWVNVQNLFNTGTVLAQDEDLTIEAVTIENQGTLSGNGLVIKAGELDNTTNTAQIVSSDKVDLTIQGEITNTDGALLHSDTDLTLDAKGNLTNSGTIEAVKSTTVKSQNLTNSGTVLAQDSGLSIETNKLENQGTLSGNGLVIKAGELDNTTNTAQIVSSD